VGGLPLLGEHVFAYGGVMASDGASSTVSDMAIDTANETGSCGACRAAVAGDIAIEVEVALGELAAGIRVANAEVRRLIVGGAGWSARGAWSSDHPSAWAG
jgi:poly-gamma-glutamate capsule biosynthesis protein CapA/YwtB (metallophosphatase superfamily)